MSSGGWTARIAICAIAGLFARAAPAAPADTIELDVRPRVCTLSAGDEECDTVVEAQWRSARDESLCLTIVGRPEVRECWEDHSEGRYSVSLVFRDSLMVELRDPEMRSVLASAAITVIREALQLRRKRRPPWSLLP